MFPTSLAGRRVAPHRVVMVAILALILATTSLVSSAERAHATTGINASLLLNGDSYQGTPVVQEGSTVTLRVQYSDAVAPGSTVVFDLGSAVTLSGVPEGNSAIASVVSDGNQVKITFADPWPADVNQGVFDPSMTLNKVDKSAKDEISWKIDGEQKSVTVIVRDQGDDFANVTDWSNKSVQGSDLNSYVTLVDGVVTLKPELAQQTLTYTLQLNSPEARTGFQISDLLPDSLSYVAGSFSATQVSWDADGLNRKTSSVPFTPTISGHSFTSTVDVPGPSQLTVTYQARITDLASLQAALQRQYDAMTGAGNFGINLVNTATFGQTPRTATVNLSGSVPGADPGRAFGKTADWSSTEVVVDATGKLAEPAAVSYTLNADLSQWNGTPNFTLDRNVVISDVLPEQALWLAEDASFITATGMTLTEAADCPSATEFASDAYVGQYCVTGQTLLVNIGKDQATKVAITAKAQITTIAGLYQGWTPIKDATAWGLTNEASFFYRAGGAQKASVGVNLVVLPEEVAGPKEDKDVFSKTGKLTTASVTPGESAVMSYTFVVGAGKGIDLRTSTIVDQIDPEVFDLTNLQAKVTGKYDWWRELGQADFILTTSPEGELVIALSASGIAKIDDWGVDKRLDLVVELTTKPFDGKVTKTITNKAYLVGGDGTELYWSQTSSEATSYGDEAEVRKRILDPSTSAWVTSLGAKRAADGTLEQSDYVYRIEFLPHGSYDKVVIVPVVDLLPEAIDFLGFVTEANAVTGAQPTAGPVDIGGNLVASYDAAAGTVTIEQKTGTLLNAQQTIAAYLKVKVTDASKPIVNRIGETSATIVPVDDPEATPSTPTEDPSSEPSSTDDPSTEPSSTDDPSSEPSSTDDPSSEPSSTDDPSTEPSSTDDPSSGPSSTDDPSTGPSSTDDPSDLTTEPAATSASSTTSSATSSPSATTGAPTTTSAQPTTSSASSVPSTPAPSAPAPKPGLPNTGA